MKTVIYLKTDKEVKQNAQKAAADLGLSLSDILNASLRNFIRTREVVFSNTPVMTEELEKLLGQVEEDIKTGKNMSLAFDNTEDMDRYLDSFK